uniref:Peptidase M14 domain-containing protein n=1 Tax=Glossina brevipalpis TaxID=37001 RepID=A0A1A9WUQ2_9MUSC
MESSDYALRGVKESATKKNKQCKDYRRLDWSFYPTLDEIYNWLDLIIRKWPHIVTGFNVGYSYEGRLIRGVKLSFQTGRKAIFVESNIHAREWITSAACTYLILELLFSRDPDVREMAARLDWWIVPVLNVDGFVYSHEKDRLWRKSRKPVSSDCMGVDLNRNFEYLWGRITHDPCSNQYGGTHPLSEPEVEQLTKFINSSIPEGSLKIYIALHSAAQAVLLPWTHTRELPLDYDRLMYVAKSFADAVYPRFRTKYRYGTSANILKYCGTSKDWAYAVKAIPIAFTIELPGRGRPSPFELPKGAILRVGLELLDGRNVLPGKRRTYRCLDWTFYPTLCEIYSWMDFIIKEYPKVVTSFDIGRSYEGRLIRGVKLSFKPGKKAIFIESNIHAREWITSSACTYLIMQLLFSRNPDIREMAESLDWWIIPVFNVDGFVYSHEKERLWRKSRRPASPDCIGIDLNRNFSYKWDLRKCEDPCSNVYSGPHAESEPEVEQLTNFINKKIPNGTIKIYVALHAAAQAVLFPWAHTKVPPRSYKELLHVANAFADALFPRYRTRYFCGIMANALKLVSGTSTDWAYSIKGIPIAFCIELPGKGTPKRFELPEKMILRVSAELLDGFVGMIRAVKDLEKRFKSEFFLSRRSLFPQNFGYPTFDWTTYPKLSEIYSWLDVLTTKRSNIVTDINIGTSPEGRLIRGIKISFKPGNKAIFIEANVYGKEGITSSATIYIIMKLLFSKNADVRDVAESVDWWIIPVLDVDGFFDAYEKKSLWRNSTPDFFEAYRNFNYARKPPSPHMELLKKFIDVNIPKDYLKIYITLHSGVQAVLTPRSNSEEFPANYNHLLYVAKAFVDALFPRFHTKYTYGSSANILNEKICSHGSTDWAHGDKDVPIALVIGLPKDRPMPFQLPKRAILRVSKELLDGFVGIIKAVKELSYV